MAANKQKFVSSPLVIAKAADGSDRYLYRGAPLPEDLAEGEAKRLEEFLSDEQSGDSGDAASSSKSDSK